MQVQRAVFSDDGTFPNSPLPVLIYGQAFSRDVEAGDIENRFGDNDWPARWVDSIFTYHHYHSTAHEVLGVASGSARVMLGGPSGSIFTLERGDAVLIPAGVGHKLEDASTDFSVVGAYPPGQEWDILTGKPGEREMALHAIARVPLPMTDPVAGADGPLDGAWR